MSLVTRFVPEPSLEEGRAALIAASKLALARGVTSVVDFGRFSPGETAQQAWDDFNGIKCPTLFVMLSCPCMSSKVHVEEHGIKQENSVDKSKLHCSEGHFFRVDQEPTSQAKDYNLSSLCTFLFVRCLDVGRAH